MTKTEQEAAIYACARGVPTPYFPFAGVVHGEPTIIRARFYVKRKGGSLHVQTSDESECFPGRTIVVRNGRVRYFTFIRAAEELTRAFERDQTYGGEANPHHFRSVWNRRSVFYARRKALLEVIGKDLRHVVDPRRGRPALEPEEATVPGVGITKGRSRHARKGELLEMLATMQTMLAEPIERTLNGQRMAGYSADERSNLRIALTDLRLQMYRLHKKIHDDTLVAGEQQ